MKHLVWLFIIFVCGNLKSQVATVKDSLDSPIALAFVGDDLYVCNQGTYPLTGQLARMNINNPEESYEVLFDSLSYPRSVFEHDGILYIGTPHQILTCKLQDKKLRLDTFYESSNSFPRSFVYSNDRLYVAEQGAFTSFDISQTIKARTLINSFSENPLSLTIFEDIVYIAVGKGIHKFDLNTKILSEMDVVFDKDIYSLLAIDGFLYVQQGAYSAQNNPVFVIDLSHPSTYEEFCVPPSVIGMVEHDGSIYFASLKPKFDGRPEGKILRIDKKLKYKTEIESLNIFPNPTTGEIKFNVYDFTNYNISLYSRNGQLVRRLASPDIIDIGNYPSGLYLLKVDDVLAKRSKYFKVVKVD